MPIFHLTEEVIRQMADSASFQRGKTYYAGGAVQNPVAFGDEIHARCEGSSYTPYEVRVKIGPSGITDYSCTCPRGDFCKHVVAVCLVRLHNPQSFRELPAAEQILADFSREQLVTLIKRMLDYEPRLLSLLAIANTANRGEVDRDAWLSLASEALRQEDGRLIERDLRGLMRTARDMAENEDWVGAGTVCQAILTVLAENYEDVQELDEEGGIAIFGGESVELLEECVAEGNPDGERRAGWFAALLDVELADLRLGGVDLAPLAFNLILEHATAGEWASLEERIRAQLAGKGDRMRGHLSEMLAAWHARHGDPEARAAVIRETGTPEQMAFLLVDEGRPEEALTLARDSLLHLPGLIIRLVDRLVKEGFAEQAVSFMVGLSMERASYAQWLIEYHLGREEWEQALECQARSFLRWPLVDSFLALGKTAKMTGRWEQLRLQLLQVLEGEAKWPELLAIALAEGDARRALDLYPRLSPVRRWNYRADLAKLTEKDFPAEAAAIYREMAEGHINRQQREAYREAVQCLVRAKALFERTAATAQWQKYITGLKGKYPRHRALQEELRSAGL